jgi:SSS family solute:Na+ symporter
MDVGTTGLSLIDYGIFFVALVAVLVVGFKSGGKFKNFEDYAISKRQKFSMPVLAMTLIVTAIGSNSSMGAIAEIYNDGIIYAVSDILSLVGTFLLIAYAAKFMANRYSGKFSLYGIIEEEYGERPAKLSAAISVFISLIYLSMQIIGMGYIVKTFMGLPFVWGAALSTFVFVAYSSMGGIRGVVYTDVLQFFIVLVVFPILVGVIVYKMGGLQLAFSNLPQSKKLIFDHPNILEYEYLTLFWMMPFGLLQATLIQRFLMCGSGKELNRMGMSYVLFGLVFMIMVAIIGVCGISLLQGLDSGKEVIPLLMQTYFPHGLKGLAITAFFALIMSTADSELHAAAVITTEMFIGKKSLDETDRGGKQVFWLKITSLIIGFLALALAVLDFSFIKAITIASALAFAAVNIPIFFAPFKARGSEAVGAYYGSVIGGFGGFLLLLALLGRERMYMVSFYATFFAVAGWFIGAWFIDRLQTAFWLELRDAYAPKLSRKALLETSSGYGYFIVFGILTFLIRYTLEVWDLFAPGQMLISSVFIISVSLMVILAFGDIIKAWSYKLFIVLWFLTVFFSLPFYNMLALLNHPDSIVNYTGLIISIIIMNMMLNWRLSLIMLALSAAISWKLNLTFYHHEDLLTTSQYIFLIFYILIAGVLTTMILRKIQENDAEEKLEYADAMACSIAHELKTPIANMKILLKTCPTDSKEDIENLLGRFKKSLLKGSDLISRTTQLFTGVCSGEVIDEEVNLSELITQILQNTNFSRRQRERILVDIDPDFIVCAYAPNLLTISENLLRNAYTYALLEDPDARIEIYTEGNQLIFYDTGPGVSTDRLATLFDKGVSYNSFGSGFGLYYCKLELKRIGGDITCDSKEGKFTKFTLTFPRKGKYNHKPN